MSCSGEHRVNRAIRVLMAIAVVFASFGATAAQGAEGDAAAPVLEPFDLNAMVFPLISERDPIYDSFDDCRGSGCSRLHGAIDIMRPKMTPVVAVADGVVSWMGTVEEGKCCYVFIDHPGDYKTGYIHLNNDTPGTDDGLANGIAEGITEGTVVRKGQLIGWVGDSGNAEYAGSHLHLEIRYYGNGYEERINPGEPPPQSLNPSPCLSSGLRSPMTTAPPTNRTSSVCSSWGSLAVAARPSTAHKTRSLVARWLRSFAATSISRPEAPG